MAMNIETTLHDDSRITVEIFGLAQMDMQHSMFPEHIHGSRSRDRMDSVRYVVPPHAEGHAQWDIAFTVLHTVSGIMLATHYREGS